jgi:hypothetical protein
MADNSVTITEAEFLEFRRLAVAYNLNRDDFDIREKYIPGNGAATRVEVVYDARVWAQPEVELVGPIRGRSSLRGEKCEKAAEGFPAATKRRG